MEKDGDTGDISLLFFLAGANFWAISAIFGNFWAILGNFGSFLGYFGSFCVIFGPFFGANFFWPKIDLCYFYYFFHLWHNGPRVLSPYILWRRKKKIAMKKKESRNLSHQYNDEFVQFTLSSFNFMSVSLQVQN